MNFGKLSQLFLQYANSLRAISDPTAKFRALNYKRVSEVIDTQYSASTRVTDERIDAMFISDHMKQRAKQLSRGSVRVKKVETVIPKQALLESLVAINGLGLPRAKELIKAGLTSVAQLKLQKYNAVLPFETKLFLKYKPVLRIPHEYIKPIDDIFKKLQNVVLVGSYRRDKETSGDIDAMLIDDNKQALVKFVDMLPNILSCSVFVYAQGPDKVSMILVPNPERVSPINKFTVKMDVFRVNKNESVPMLLYSTGSKEFNIRMRHVAKQRGYLLNQHGLYDVSTGKRIEGLRTEEDYFNKIELRYVKPSERR